ncbi:hypothetical protein P5673_025219 [Acropora cervicornis]|uniref:Uncharacterized protein n=1 Tax=Acropora cervicornis TaxID=6130 RepID=A0AAD9UXQ7_ACRCE|nr:hypothetical protein P5673_025219 [Acropora cervicornis]
MKSISHDACWGERTKRDIQLALHSGRPCVLSMLNRTEIKIMVSLELFPIGSSFLLTKFIPFISFNKLHNNLDFDLPYISEGDQA